MRTIGIFTRDFSVFHDLVRFLKERNVEFFSLRPGLPPPWITVVITTQECRHEVEFDHVIIADRENVVNAVDEAVLTRGQDRQYFTLVIGIDPGERPGVAVYGDRTLLMTEKVEVPEDIGGLVNRITGLYRADTILIRIGNGAPTYRNRIINVLLPLGVKVEIVDERSTTIKHRTPDIQAAISIARKTGKNVDEELKVVPSQGEVDDLKRRSRLLSGGRFTISSDQAESVIRGQMSLAEVIRKRADELFGKQKGSNPKDGDQHNEVPGTPTTLTRND